MCKICALLCKYYVVNYRLATTQLNVYVAEDECS